MGRTASKKRQAQLLHSFMDGATALVLDRPLSRRRRRFPVLLQAIAASRSISSVALYNSFCASLAPEQLHELVQHLSCRPDLQHLSIMGTPAFIKERYTFLQFSLRNFVLLLGNAKKLKTLTIMQDVTVFGTRCDLYDFAKALSNLPALQEFRWHGHLRIDNERLPLPHYEPIAAALTHNVPPRTVSLAVPLDPFDVHRRGPDVAEPSVARLAQSCTELHLWTDHWGAVRDGLACAACRVHDLHLQKRHVSLSDGEHLGAALRTNASVATLCIECYSIGDAALQAVAAGLNENTNVKVLQLRITGSFCYTSSVDATLCKLLSTNLGLTFIGCSGSFSSIELQMHSLLNAAGRKRMWEGTATCYEWADALERLAAEEDSISLNCLYAMIRSHPALCSP